MLEDYTVLLLLGAGICLVLPFLTLLFSSVNKRLGTKNRKVKAMVVKKSLEDQQYSFTPTEADIPRYGNNLVYRLYVEVEGKVCDLLTNPTGYQSIKVGDVVEVTLYHGRFFKKTYIDW